MDQPGDIALIQRLPSQLSMAREFALLGNYESSMLYYDAVLGMIQSYLRTVHDSYHRQNWQKVCLMPLVDRTESITCLARPFLR